jgi:eukaryotic-like serine/threonine-protein kinase
MTAGSDGYPRIILSGTDLDLPPDFTNSFSKYAHFQPITKTGKTILESCWDSSTGRTIALKRLQPQVANDEKERRRFLREARVTAQLAHPNTVPVYEIGHDNEGGLYFTMKKIAGEDMFKILQRLSWGDKTTSENYPVERLLDMVIQTSLALAYAHVHGVIHRDVKPENIWVGNFGEVILLDWGVAKVWGRVESPLGVPESLDDSDGGLSLTDSKQLQTLTLTGERPGTPLYMSPEQVQGHKYIDERTDIFSMGVVMYEMLTFKEPFRGHNINETFDNIVNHEPVPPSELPLPRNAVPRAIPKSLEAVILKAVSKEPKDRFQSMLEMIEAVRASVRDIVRLG